MSTTSSATNIIRDFAEYLLYELNRSPLTAEAYTRDLSEFASWLSPSDPGKAILNLATTSDIRAWLSETAASGHNSRTVRRKTQSLRTFYRYLLRRNMINTNPTADIRLARLPKPLPDFVPETDLEEILNCCPDPDTGNIISLRNHLILNILYTTGIRQAELLAINDSDISTENRQLTVNGKRRKQRIIPLPGQLLDEITRWQQVRDSHSPKSKEDTCPLITCNGRRMSKSSLYNTIRKLLAPTSCARKSPHTIRHSFATAMLNDGADINSVKEFLGHSSLRSTQIYTHLTTEEMKRAYSAAHPRGKKNPDE